VQGFDLFYWVTHCGAHSESARMPTVRWEPKDFLGFRYHLLEDLKIADLVEITGSWLNRRYVKVFLMKTLTYCFRVSLYLHLTFRFKSTLMIVRHSVVTGNDLHNCVLLVYLDIFKFPHQISPSQSMLWNSFLCCFPPKSCVVFETSSFFSADSRYAFVDSFG
jgi:hypothetical protein